MDTQKPKKKSVPKVVKDLAWNKWVGEDVARTKCLCCGVNEIKMSSFHCGHIVATVNDGKTTVDNLRPICAACNLSMGVENMDEFKARCGFPVCSTGPPPVEAGPEEPVFWTPGMLQHGTLPNLIKWRPGTDSIKMGQELSGKYTYRPQKGLYERNRYYGE